MKKAILHPFFLFSVLVYLVLFTLKKTGLHIPFVSDYLADFLCLPVILSVALWAIRHFSPEKAQFTFHWGYTLFAFGFFSLLFEGLFPLLTPRFTADWWDLLAYGLGGLLFHFWLNKPAKKTKLE